MLPVARCLESAVDQHDLAAAGLQLAAARQHEPLETQFEISVR
jgi:hypothetical protein